MIISKQNKELHSLGSVKTYKKFAWLPITTSIGERVWLEWVNITAKWTHQAIKHAMNPNVKAYDWKIFSIERCK